MTILRTYQRQALDSFWSMLSPSVNRLAIVLPTGAGKTITFAAAADEWLDGDDLPHSRVLVIVNSLELLRQAVEKITFVTQGRWTIGRVQGDEYDEVDADIVVAMVQTLAQPGRKQRIKHVSFVIVDEVQYALAPTYLEALRHFRVLPDTANRPVWPPTEADREAGSVPMLGVTATLYRGDGQGFGHLIQDIAFSRTLPWAIRQGFLLDFVPYAVRIPVTATSDSREATDALMADSVAPEAVVGAWVEQVGWHPADRRSTILFAPLVRSAEVFADAFELAGVKAEVISDRTPAAERRAILARYEAGVTTVLCNATLLSVGWDSPRTMCVVWARVVRAGSPLFPQALGRGLRPWLDADAPPREAQGCTVLVVTPQAATFELGGVADLSDHPGEVSDGKSFLAMSDEWDIGAGLAAQAEADAYRGPVTVERWDAAVQTSAKAWKYTAGGVPFLPIAKRGEGYVFIVRTAAGWDVRAARREAARVHAPSVTVAPDLELAMATAEDAAQERGGDIGRLLADKARPWRRKIPSAEQITEARRVGVPDKAVAALVSNKAGGKAGRLSDLIDVAVASRTLDPIAQRIMERTGRS